MFSFFSSLLHLTLRLTPKSLSSLSLSFLLFFFASSSCSSFPLPPFIPPGPNLRLGYNSPDVSGSGRRLRKLRLAQSHPQYSIMFFRLRTTKQVFFTKVSTTKKIITIGMLLCLLHYSSKNLLKAIPSSSHVLYGIVVYTSTSPSLWRISLLHRNSLSGRINLPPHTPHGLILHKVGGINVSSESSLLVGIKILLRLADVLLVVLSS